MSKFSKRLRYSVGGTYRWYGPGKSLSVDKGSSRFFFIFTERLTKEGYGSPDKSGGKFFNSI